MNPELALQRLEEVREFVDGDIEELVDSLAMVLRLQQDISNPMYGAKITLHLPADGNYVECSAEQYEDLKGQDWPAMSYKDDGDVVHKKFVVADDEHREVTDYGTIARRAIVFESDVAGNAPDEDLWDPNEGEYRRPDEYPMGTVNCVVPQSSGSEFGEDYVYDTEVYTSITPADEHPGGHTYTPGWPE